MGPINILINSAGITKRTPIVDMTVKDFTAVITVDLISPFIVSKNVAKGMIQRGGGKIINICSMMGALGRDSVSAYAAAKGVLKILTKNMATEWAKFNNQSTNSRNQKLFLPLAKAKSYLPKTYQLVVSYSLY